MLLLILVRALLLIPLIGLITFAEASDEECFQECIKTDGANDTLCVDRCGIDTSENLFAGLPPLNEPHAPSTENADPQGQASDFPAEDPATEE